MNTLRTFRECVSNGLQMRGEYSTTTQYSATKCPQNIPQNVHIQPQNTPTRTPQGIFINSLRPFHQQKQLVLGFVTLCVAEIIWHVLFS